MSDAAVGAWTTFSCDITKEAREAFETALKGLTGVGYKPVAFASQVVSGMNYRFFCNARVVSPDAPNEAALIDIYQPLDGPAHITNTRRIEP